MATITNNLSKSSTIENNLINEETSPKTHTPTGSMSPAPETPTKKSPTVSKSPKSKIITDRFIPLRDHNNWQNRMALTLASQVTNQGITKCLDGFTYSRLLRNEIFGTKYCNKDTVVDTKSPEKTKLFKYMSPSKENNNLDSSSSQLYSLSPLSNVSQKILNTPTRTLRKIPRLPYKILDAPDLQDDFYLNLVDWSSQNMLSVGLSSSVYLWSAITSQVTRLCNLESDGNLITSVSWNKKGNMIAVGTNFGCIHVWDITTLKKVTTLRGHTARIGSLSWNGNLLSSGSRDRLIFVNDLRVSRHAAVRKLLGHRQEVCGLKWSPDGRHLASGGNDNRVFVWNLNSTAPVQCYTKHTAAVKAIAWSPHHHGLLASGGGTADRCIRFWNTLTGQPMQVLDTGSQVCNIAWSKNSSELVSTHGYTQNQIYIWNYPSLLQVTKLMGHSFRVLYLAMSPTGESIVTGAGDETLRFWNIFNKAPSQKERRSVLNLYTNIR